MKPGASKALRVVCNFNYFINNHSFGVSYTIPVFVDGCRELMSDQSLESPLGEPDVQLRWTTKDTGWMFSHVGTGIGAGLLYLPINAGIGGFWPLLLMALVSGPMVYFTHRTLTRFCLASRHPGNDFSMHVEDTFGSSVAKWLMLVCFLSMFPVLLLYTIGISNVTISFLVNQLNWAEPSRPLVVLLLVTAMVGVFLGTEQRLLNLFRRMVLPLTIVLLGIALYLIPQWRIDYLMQPVSVQKGAETFLLALPVLVFSFYHAPVCSAFARSYRQENPDLHACIRKTDSIHRRSAMILLIITLFFVFSCVMALTPEQLAQAKADNLPTLSILANQPGNRFFSTITPLIAFVAIMTSFFGFFLGVIELMNGLLSQGVRSFRPGKVVSAGHVHRISLLIIALSCSVAGVGNWSVLGIMEAIVAPMMAVIIFFLPIAGMYRVTKLQQYRKPVQDIFTLVVGTMVIAGFVISQLL